MRARALVSALAAVFLLAPIRMFPQRAEPSPNARKMPFTLAQVWRLDGVYTDPQRGVSFRYPSVWKAANGFGYWPPALAESDQAKPIAGFAYREGLYPRDEAVGPYYKTNLEGFGIVYSAVPATNASACDAIAAAIANSQDDPIVTFGGRKFSVRATQANGMSQATYGNLYATYAGSTCYLFETGVAGIALDRPEYLAPALRRSIEAHLLAIMKTVQIAPEGRKAN
jgi:hypothetical protein